MKIELKSLSKQFEDGRLILREMDFSQDIHTLSVIGPSGGGKSTLLRILGGLLPPTSGQVWVDGEEITANQAAMSHYRRQVGFVFQQGGLFKHMTGMQNITLPLVKVHGYTPRQAEVRATHLLERFGLLEHAMKKPAALSGGQQQRIAIARAIAPKPKLLLLDEPTSALDPEYTTEVLNMIGELRQEGIDYVIVTHEMGFARHACDQAVFLSGGSLLEAGESSQLFSNPQTPQLRQFLSRLLEWTV